MSTIELDLPPNDQTVAVKTLDPETLKPPKTRLGMIWAIRDRIAEFRRLDQTRSERRAKVQNWIDGARPFSVAKLRSLGQGDRTNFNPREAEGMVDAAKTPYFGLVFRNPKFATIENNYGDNVQTRRQIGLTQSKNYHKMLEEWSGFDYQMQLKHQQMVTFGVGYAMFPDAETWQWQSRKIGEVLVPDEIPALIDTLPEACYFTKISPVDLYKMVADEESAKKMGWKPDVVKRIIVQHAPETVVTSPMFGREWGEEWAASLRRGDVMWNGSRAQIRLAGYLVKEFSGKISRCLLVDSQDAITNTAAGDEQFLMFKKVDEFECFDQILQPFFHDVGTGEWHSVRGLGGKIRDLTLANARLFCRIIDGGGKAAGYVFQAADAAGEQIGQMIEISGANIIPASLKLERNEIGKSLEGPMNVRREIQDALQTSTAQYLPRVSAENSEPTLGQAQQNARNQLQLSESGMDRYCKSLDRLHKEKARRAFIMGMKLYKARHRDESDPPDDYAEVADFANDAEKGAYWLIRRCVEDGTPIEACDPKYICNVKASRGVGSGSPAGTDIATRELLAMIPTMEERGRRNALRARAAFLMGYSNVDDYYPPFDEAGFPDDHAALATLENNALRVENGEVLVTSEQDDVIHAKIHLTDAFEDVKGLQSGQRDPKAVLVHLFQTGPHVKAHMDQIVGDPSRKDVFKQLEGAWQALSKVSDQLHQQLMESMQAQQQQAQQQQPQIDPQLMALMEKTKAEIGIKQMRAQADIQLKADKQRATSRLKDLAQAHSMMLKNRETASTIQAQQIEAQKTEPQLATA